MQRKIETFQVVPAENFRKEEVLYRFTRSKYFKCYGNLSVISFNFVNQLKAFAAVFFSQAPEWELDSYAKSRVISLECCLRVGQIANLPIFLGILQFGYSEQTGVISTSTRHYDFPPSGRLSRSPRTRWLAASFACCPAVCCCGSIRFTQAPSTPGQDTFYISQKREGSADVPAIQLCL